MLNPFLVVLIKKKECTYGNMGIVIQGHSLDEILDSPPPDQPPILKICPVGRVVHQDSNPSRTMIITT